MDGSEGIEESVILELGWQERPPEDYFNEWFIPIFLLVCFCRGLVTHCGFEDRVSLSLDLPCHEPRAMGRGSKEVQPGQGGRHCSSRALFRRRG